MSCRQILSEDFQGSWSYGVWVEGSAMVRMSRTSWPSCNLAYSQERLPAGSWTG